MATKVKSPTDTQTINPSDVGEMPKDLVPQGTKAMSNFDYGEHAAPVGKVAAGFENQGAQDVSIPFLTLLQPISPVIVENKVEGAKVGMWMNTVTHQYWENPRGLLFVPATTRHEWVQFCPRTMGGGFVERYSIDSEVVAKSKARSKKFGEYYVDSEDGRTGDKGDELTETFYVFGALCDEETAFGFAIIAFKGTMIRSYKNLMSVIRAHTIDTPAGKRTPPIFAHLIRITSEGKKNNEGFFYVPVMAPAIGGSVAKSLLSPEDDRFKMALACRTMVEFGTAKVNYDKQSAQDGNTKGEDVPF